MDGSHMSDLLLERGYEVHGTMRRASQFNTQRVDHLYKDPHTNDVRFFLHFADLLDPVSVERVVRLVKPDEVYNFSAQSQVRVSFDLPRYSFDVTATGAITVFEAIRTHCPEARIYQASSSEMFGDAPPPQNEMTRFHPCSPYGVAKVAAYHSAVMYREAYGMFISNGILGNHESARRGPTFVTKKVTTAVGQIKAGRQTKLYLGNLRARRDWGYAPDYVEAMTRILEHDTPDDFVIGTGEDHSVEEFVDLAFTTAGLKWQDHVVIDARYYRPKEVDHLRMDATKARKVLGWTPTVTFRDIVKIMVGHDIDQATKVGAQ